MTDWVVEASTYCNLRCAYCYQWDGLADRTRMSLEQWAKTLRAVCEYHRRRRSSVGAPTTSRVIWHGGEPLALPLNYLERTFELKRQILDEHAIPPSEIETALQTNLFAVSDEMIEMLKRHEVGVGVSFDVVRGMRVAANGRTSEDRVLANMDRLRAAGIRYGAITVLASHTCDRIDDVFDFWASRSMSFRVLPLFDGPAGRPTTRFHAEERQLVAALCRLFVRWIESGSPITIAPLDEYLTNVVCHLVRADVEPYDRRLHGESVLVVHPDGQVFQVAEAGNQSYALGDLRVDSIDNLLAGRAYEESLKRSAALSRMRCHQCQFRAGCNGYPAHCAPTGSTWHGRCHVAYLVQAFMVRFLRAAGMRDDDLRTLIAKAVRRESEVTPADA
jgi:uncharacterized protein